MKLIRRARVAEQVQVLEPVDGARPRPSSQAQSIPHLHHLQSIIQRRTVPQILAQRHRRHHILKALVVQLDLGCPAMLPPDLRELEPPLDLEASVRITQAHRALGQQLENLLVAVGPIALRSEFIVTRAGGNIASSLPWRLHLTTNQ